MLLSRVFHTYNSHLDKELGISLLGVNQYTNSSLRICKLSYDQRNAPELRRLSIMSSSNSGFSENFKKIRHNFGRLGLTMKAVEQIMIARFDLPDLLRNNLAVRRASLPTGSNRTTNYLHRCGISLVATLRRLLLWEPT